VAGSPPDPILLRKHPQIALDCRSGASRRPDRFSIDARPGTSQSSRHIALCAGTWARNASLESCYSGRSGRARRGAGRAPSTSVLIASRYEHELSLDAEFSSSSCACRASASGICSATTGSSLSSRSSSSSALKSSRNQSGFRGPPPTATSAHGEHLVAFAQPLDRVDEQPSAGREQAPARDSCGRRVPLGPASPALAPVRHRARVAVRRPRVERAAGAASV
jgi:hypothetical protein